MKFSINFHHPNLFSQFSKIPRLCRVFGLMTLLLIGQIAAASINAQDKISEIPPPLKMLSKAEKTAIERQTDVKKRTVLTLDLMEARLVKAETAKAQENYLQMFDELGGFYALMDNTLAYLNQNNARSGKVLDNFKRIELSLRKYINRLELIRRDLPNGYEPYVRRLVRYVREARTKAVEPLFGDTVLPDKNNE